MDALTILTMGAIFLFTASLVAGVTAAVGSSRAVEHRRVRKRMLYLSAGVASPEAKHDLLKSADLSSAELWEKWFATVPRPARLDRLLLRSRAPFGLLGFFCLTAILGFGGLAAGLIWLPIRGLAFVPALILAALPWLILRAREERSLKKLEEQLPDALDLMARALRAGHALNTGMEMVAEEMAEPIRSEFAAVVDEVRLGLKLSEALDNLSRRAPLTDLRFFAVTVALHRETGGNLTEVFDKIARLIRERQQFRRQVEALTAEGRFSAVVLLLLPAAMALYLFLSNRDYLEPLWMDPFGQLMALAALVCQFVGYFVMRRMAQLDV